MASEKSEKESGEDVQEVHGGIPKQPPVSLYTCRRPLGE
jgi:hypothetical protein